MVLRLALRPARHFAESMLCHVFDPAVPGSARQGVFDMMEQFDRPEFVMNAAFQQQALI